MATRKTKLKSKREPKLSAARILQQEQRHLIGTYKRPPVVFTHGKGCYLYDSRGRAYLDFLGGIAVNALGYSHPRLVRVMRREAARAVHLSNLFHNPFQGSLAIKLGRAYSKKNRVAGAPAQTRFLALENSFHGRTFGAVSITYPAKYREPFAPLVPGAEFVKFNDVSDLERKFDDSVCALVVETIQGEGGIFPVSREFWKRARELATQHDAALIADEIQCGLGRTGRHFAYQALGSLPDVVTVAKPLAGGLPLGAFIANEKFAAAFTPGMHGTTFGGGPLVCATALEFLTVVEEEKLLTNIRERGAELRAGIEKLAGKFDFIRDVRGEGLMLGVDLSVDGAPFIAEALRSGLIMNCTHEHILRLLPAFIIKRRDVAEFLAKFETVLVRAAKSLEKSRSKTQKTETHAQPMTVAAAR